MALGTTHLRVPLQAFADHALVAKQEMEMDWLVFVAGGSAFTAVAAMAVANFLRGPKS